MDILNEKKNEDIVRKMGEIRVEVNWRRGRLKNKWLEILKEDIRSCGVDENIVRDRKVGEKGYKSLISPMWNGGNDEK